MARYNLAARSLRHLRFARQMMVGQPLLARVSDAHHPPAYVSDVTYVSLDGHHLPVGRILRRMPRHEMTLSAGHEAPGDGLAADSVAMLPAEAMLRLLPRLPDVDAGPWADAAEGQLRAPAQEPYFSHDAPPPSQVSPAPSVAEEMPSASMPTRPDGQRPRSRIVELPGIVSQPREDGISADFADDMSPAARASAHNAAADPQEVEASPATIGPTAATPATATSSPPAPAQRRRSKRSAATPPPRASDALFPPTDADRSPQAWLARLRGEKPAPPDPKPGEKHSTGGGSAPPPAEQPAEGRKQKGSRPSRGSSVRGPRRPATPEAPDAPVVPSSVTTTLQPPAAERPATLPDSSRAMLHTLTGVDPASVHIYRGPVAERVTSAQNADALTDGDMIALGAGHATDSPRALGLIAHELTHIAHRRSPRFVPPVAQGASRRPYSDAAPAAPPNPPQPAVSSADEEAEAAQVEASVTHIASTQIASPSVVQPALPVLPVLPTQPPPTPPSAPEPQPPAARPVWGSLPAPWEPLPDWLAHPVSPTSAPTSAVTQQPGQPMSAARPAPDAASRAPVSDAPSTQRAEHGRSLPAVEAASPQTTHAREGGVPEPDLDALAQQVHAILKRRLAAERRRFG